VYLFAGEAYDAALGLYYNRARYLNTSTGRFWTMDEDGFGDEESPATLHKYVYATNDPVDLSDPSGNEIDAIGALSISGSLDSISVVNVSLVIAEGIRQATTLSEQGLKFIAIEEGLVTHLYNDLAGHCTIGYGHLVSLNKCSQSAEAAQYKMGITKTAAQNLLWQDAQDTIQDVRTYTSVALAQKEFDAITDFVFNEGPGNYQISDLRKTLNQGLYSLVPPLFFHFTRAGKYPNALRSRRQDEADLFTSGVYRARGQLIN
jgi:RHS repeat-associated protein